MEELKEISCEECGCELTNRELDRYDGEEYALCSECDGECHCSRCEN